MAIGALFGFGMVNSMINVVLIALLQGDGRGRAPRAGAGLQPADAPPWGIAADLDGPRWRTG